MKKFIATVSVLGLAALMLGAVAWAQGPGYGRGYGYHMNGMYGPGYQANSPAWAKFQQQTLGLRKQLSTAVLERDTLASQPEPNQARINTLNQNIADLQSQITQQGQAAGLANAGSAWGRGPGSRMGYGGGPGYCWR